MDADTLTLGLMWFTAFLLSTTVHEALHALAALRGGDRTAYLGGQVSLSPLPHIRREPIGMLEGLWEMGDEILLHEAP
jgi:hypothetical protein